MAACLPTEGLIPLDQPRFPTGLAVTPDGEHLLAVSSNFDLAYDDGALLVADLDKVRAKTGDADAVVKGAWVGAAVLPPFGDAPTLSSDGTRVWVANRGDNIISSLDLNKNGKLGCGEDAGDPPRCGVTPRALQLPANDPFGTQVLSEQFDSDGKLTRMTGMSTLLSSPDVYFFTDDSTREAAQRMQISGTTNLGVGVRGVRSVAVRPAQSGSAQTAIAALELDPATGIVGVLLALFEPRADANVRVFDVTSELGSLGARDVLLVPGDDGENDALLVVLRDPEGIARYELDDDNGSPLPRLSGVAPTCRAPTSLALARPVPGIARVLLTCQEGDVVQMLDPVTLSPTDAVRFEGRGPYDVVVNGSATPPEAYVSFFLDNSIGVLSLEHAGEPALRFVGRIGAATPRPEDGRE